MRAVAVAIVLAMPLAGSASAAPAADPVGWQRPLVRIATEARRWLGDPHVAIVGVYSTTARALARASNQAVPPEPDQDVYVLVLHGHFTCRLCSRPPGAPAQRGMVAACVWSATRCGCWSLALATAWTSACWVGSRRLRCRDRDADVRWRIARAAETFPRIARLAIKLVVRGLLTQRPWPWRALSPRPAAHRAEARASGP